MAEVALMPILGAGLQFILLSAYLTALQRSGTFARGAGADNAWELGASNTFPSFQVLSWRDIHATPAT
jgi:hypothetical protein